jgi:hypothetical protein
MPVVVSNGRHFSDQKQIKRLVIAIPCGCGDRAVPGQEDPWCQDVLTISALHDYSFTVYSVRHTCRLQYGA